MLDVHPPHESIQNWKTYLLHMSMIVLGLLIAIGLEQTVEAIHHTHQRHELIEDFRNECRRNIDITDANLIEAAAFRDWELAWIAALEDAEPKNGVITITVPPFAFGKSTGPSRAVWSVAKSNGKVALLPEDLAEIYDRTDYEAAGLIAARQDDQNAAAKVGAVFDELRLTPEPGHSLSIKAQNLHLLAAALARDLEQRDSERLWAAYLNGACRAVLDNVPDRAAMDPYMYKEAAKFPQK